MKKERPILYSTPMVQAKLDGRKFQTRRVIKESFNGCFTNGTLDAEAKCPYGAVGDILWTREAWSKNHYEGVDAEPTYFFKAGGPDVKGIWKPSIHMPKKIARIWEEITAIRVERLNSIDDGDAIAEGIYKPLGSQFYQATNGNGPWGENPVQTYKNLWELINGEGSWDVDPWVWVITTKVLSTTGRPANI